MPYLNSSEYILVKAQLDIFFIEERLENSTVQYINYQQHHDLKHEISYNYGATL